MGFNSGFKGLNVKSEYEGYRKELAATDIHKEGNVLPNSPAKTNCSIQAPERVDRSVTAGAFRNRQISYEAGN